MAAGEGHAGAAVAMEAEGACVRRGGHDAVAAGPCCAGADAEVVARGPEEQRLGEAPGVVGPCRTLKQKQWSMTIVGFVLVSSLLI